MFWGRDAADLATAVGAPALADGQFGWRDMDVAEVVERGTAAEKLRTERGWKLATDFRPHSHHWALLEIARAAETESATIDVGDLRGCLFFTTWGALGAELAFDVSADPRKRSCYEPGGGRITAAGAAGSGSNSGNSSDSSRATARARWRMKSTE